jgi:hypothetical protein
MEWTPRYDQKCVKNSIRKTSIHTKQDMSWVCMGHTKYCKTNTYCKDWQRPTKTYKYYKDRTKTNKDHWNLILQRSKHAILFLLFHYPGKKTHFYWILEKVLYTCIFIHRFRLTEFLLLTDAFQPIMIPKGQTQ